MDSTDNIQINLIKLADGGRLLRLVDLPSGLALEKKLDPAQPVVRQKARLMGIFQAALAHPQLAA